MRARVSYCRAQRRGSCLETITTTDFIVATQILRSLTSDRAAGTMTGQPRTIRPRKRVIKKYHLVVRPLKKKKKFNSCCDKCIRSESPAAPPSGRRNPCSDLGNSSCIVSTTVTSPQRTVTGMTMQRPESVLSVTYFFPLRS